MPTTIHWVNYWSEDIVNEIGMERIQRIQRILEKKPEISFRQGILLMKETALDINKEDEIKP